jgi:3-oxoacyl-[acyl-carrier-protein] synthase-3
VQELLKRVPLAKISAIGTAVPPGLLTNQDLEKLVETNDQWIIERTGIKRRHIVGKGVACSDLCTEAALKVIEKAGIKPTDVDLIIVATITPDMQLPATACLVQHNIGAVGAWGFDMSIACSGFLYALQVACQFVATGAHKNVIAIGMDVMSSIIDYTDRQTCIIFGDGGGAALVQPADKNDHLGIIDFVHEVDGSGGPSLCLPAGGSRNPTTEETLAKRMHYVHQDGKAVFKFATRKMAEVCVRLLERHGLTGKDLDLFIPHQANLRIINAAVERLEVPMEKVIVNIDEYGNTTAGTIPLAIQTALDEGKLKKGDLVLLASMGAGFSAGATLVRWAY